MSTLLSYSLKIGLELQVESGYGLSQYKWLNYAQRNCVTHLLIPGFWKLLFAGLSSG